MAEKDKKPSKKEKNSQPTSETPKDESAIVKAQPSDVETTSEKRVDEVEGDVLPPGALQNMPPEVRQTLQSYFAMFSKTTSGPRPNPLFEKFTPEHIDKYLDYVQRDDDHEYELNKTNRWFYLAYAVISLSVFSMGVVYLLPKDRDLLMQLITLIVVLGGGVGAGYGLSKKN